MAHASTAGAASGAQPAAKRMAVPATCLGRRQAALLLGSAVLASLPQPPAHASGARALQRQQQQPSCEARLDAGLASTLLGAAARRAEALARPAELQVERFALQQQERRFYLGGGSQGVGAAQLPDLSDASGGLSERRYFDFVSYVLWKVIARHLPASPAARAAFCAAVGADVLAAWALDLLAASVVWLPWRAPAAALLALLRDLLDRLQASGYVCGWQLTWGSHPGSWPGDWAAAEPGLVDAEQALAQQQPAAPGTLLQIKLLQPADLQAAVALRSESDAFYSRSAVSLLLALLAAAGHGQAACDEFFVQDLWSGPASARDRLLLLLGDPLEAADVPFEPSSLICNLTL